MPPGRCKERACGVGFPACAQAADIKRLSRIKPGWKHGSSKNARTSSLIEIETDLSISIWGLEIAGPKLISRLLITRLTLSNGRFRAGTNQFKFPIIIEQFRQCKIA